MEIEERVKEDISIISISGRMDAVSSREAEAKLEDLLNENKTIVIINLEGMDYISSVGLRTLMIALKKQKSNRGQLALIHLQPFVKNIFKITGLDKIFLIYSTEEEAIQDLRKGANYEYDKVAKNCGVEN
jgi:anti-sigma B factor antagonist